MFRFFRAGAFAAWWQFVAVISITLAFVVASLCHVIEGDLGSRWLPLLAATYVIFAGGFATSTDRSLVLTARRIYLASQSNDANETNKLSERLATLLVLASILVALIALRTPPTRLIETRQRLGWGGLAWVVWSGSLSVAVAWFGANAHAAVRALTVRRRDFSR